MKEGAKIPIQITGGSLGQAGSCSNAEACLLVLAAGVALAPVGAIVGGVESAISADGTEVNIRGAKINQALIDMCMNEHMRERFYSRLADLKTFPAKILQAVGPEKSDEKPDYRSIRSDGIDTVSEITVQQLALSGFGVVQPDLSVFLGVQVRLISTVDNKELFSKRYTCVSKEYTFGEWAANDAQRFREEILRCYDVIAEKAVFDLFVDKTLLQKNLSWDKIR